jgi:hypothetical protein
MKNGELLLSAELAGYEVLLPVDQGLPAQQNLSGRKIAIVVLGAPTNQLEDLARFVPQVEGILLSIQPSTAIHVALIARHHVFQRPTPVLLHQTGQVHSNALLSTDNKVIY